MGTGNDINEEKRNGNKDRKFRNKDNSNAPYDRKALKNKKTEPPKRTSVFICLKYTGMRRNEKRHKPTALTASTPKKPRRRQQPR